MSVIIFGAQNLMVKKQISKYINEAFPDATDVDVTYLNSHDIDQETLLNECAQLSLVNPYKLVVLENCNFLTGERSKDKFSYNEKLLSYLQTENPNVKLVFSVIYSGKLDSRNKVVKLISTKGKIIECKDLKIGDWHVYAQKFFERRNVKITKEALYELCDRSDGSLDIFLSETNKLLLYKMNNIDINDINLIVTKPLNNNVYDILKSLLNGNKEKTIQIYRDLRLEKVEPVILISIIANSLLFADQVLFLNSKHYSTSSISQQLKCNPYRTIITLKDFRNIGCDVIEKTLEKLYLLDKEIKHNNIDRFYAFEMFIVNF